MIKVKGKKQHVGSIPAYVCNVSLDFENDNQEVTEFTSVLMSLTSELKECDEFGKKFINNYPTIIALKELTEALEQYD